MHELLERQIEKHLGASASIPPEWEDFLDAVNGAYHQADEDRELLERSLDLTSEELVERNERLRDELERREEAERRLHSHVQRQTAIAQLGRLTLRGISMEAVVSEALSMIARILDVPYCSLLRLGASGEHLRLKAGVGWDDEELGSIAFSAAGDTQAAEALAAREPVVVASFSSDSRVDPGPHLAGRGVESGGAVVIDGGDVVWGGLGAHDTTERGFSQDDVDFLRSVANVLAQGIQRRRANRLLQESEARFRAVSENAAELIAILDRKGALRHAYGAAEAITGFTAEELKDVEGMERIHPQDRHELVATWREERTRPGEIFQVEFRFRHRDGAWRFLSVQGRNLLDQPGVEGILVNVRDVTQRRQSERELLRAKEQAEEMVELKNAFLANMSHEIRTPLTAIMGFADALLREMSGQEQEFARLIRDGGKRLSETLNSVLALARLEANESELALETVNVRDVVEETVELFRSMVEQEDLALQVDVEDGVWAHADRGALMRILNNLVSNAVKFTEEGTVRIRVRGGDDSVLLHVEDTGIGINETFQDELFDEFKQESTGRDRNYEGTGLGLTITERLTELMDGEISVNSEKGEGSVFTVRLKSCTSVASETLESEGAVS
jgi:PAS domain S-box-containing protein